MSLTRGQALEWLGAFVEGRLKDFGPYEDAIRSDARFLFHSLLSAPLNLGLLRPEDWSARLASWRNSLKEFHRKNPLLPGIPKEEFRSRELPGAPAFLFDELLASEKLIAVSGDTVRLASNKLALKQDEA